MERFDPGWLFGAVRRGVLDALSEREPLVVAIDDTTSRKRGLKIPGAAWRRDPTGPHFSTNFIWGRRFLQLSAVLPAGKPCAPGRAIPIALHHAPSPKKPSKRDPPEAWAAYRTSSKAQSLTRQAVEELRLLREQMAGDGQASRPIRVVGDGGYTNKTVLRQLPPNAVFIGRIRSDAQLFQSPLPGEKRGRGRRPSYGLALPTPEQIRQDESIPWSVCPVYAGGKVHSMKYKTVGPVLWRAAGADRPMQLVVVAPLAYRPTARSKLLYRNPAYLVCTDPQLPAEAILPAYVSRWDIEVNFRDEKHLLGLDEAQVRNSNSARTAPALAAGAYALLLLAAHRAFGANGVPDALPPPKWRRATKPPRASTALLMNHLRLELWGQSLGTQNFSSLVDTHPPSPKPENFIPCLSSTLFYAQPH